MSYVKCILWAVTAALLSQWGLSDDDPCYSEALTTHPCTWTCMLLTLQWPGSFCIGLTNKTICKIPPTLQNWTIHGLWPMHAGNCCTCWRIFQSHLQEIEPDLTQVWPSLIKGEHYFYFWQKEWFKHGTCAGCYETFGSPFLYFQAAVNLRKLFDINSVLSTSGIKNSCEVSYKHEDILKALAPLLGNNFDLQCLKDSKDREVMYQLKIHLSQNQTLGCTKQEEVEAFQETTWSSSSAHPCPKNNSIFYVPINYDNPHEPCI